jgi:hypothetical protein
VFRAGSLLVRGVLWDYCIGEWCGCERMDGCVLGCYGFGVLLDEVLYGIYRPDGFSGPERWLLVWSGHGVWIEAGVFDVNEV